MSSERGPAWARRPDSWPQLPRWTLRERLADRRAARRPLTLERLRRLQAEADRVADQRHRGAVAERRPAEALRAWATSRDPTDDHQQPQREEPPAGRPHRSRDWPSQDRGHGPDHP